MSVERRGSISKKKIEGERVGGEKEQRVEIRSRKIRPLGLLQTNRDTRIRSVRSSVKGRERRYHPVY